MDFSIITLILNVLLLVFVGFGFLFGLRGVKKATRSLITFIVAMFIVFLISPAITGLILNINIDGMAIKEHISSAVNSALGEEIASQTFVEAIVSNIPNMVVNILTTIILIIIVGLLCKLVVAILCKIFIKNENEKEIEKCEIVNGSPQMVKVKVKAKKHRLAGGLVGAFKGLLVCLAMFMPIVGLGNIIGDIAGVNKVSAETTSGTELKLISELIQEDLPKEVFDAVDAINSSIFSKIGRIGNVGEVSLNMVSKCSINGKSVRLGQEVKALCGTYDKFVEFTRSSNTNLTNIEEIFADMIENPNNYDFELLDEVIEELFNSNLIVATGNDILIFAVDSFSTNANDSTKVYLSYLKKAVENYSQANYSLKDDIKAFLKVFEISAKSDLLKVFQSEEIKIDDISNVLLNEANEETGTPKNKVLNELSEAITSSYLLQKVAIESANYGIDELEKVLNKGLKFEGGITVSLKNIDSKSSLSIKETELSNLFEAVCKTINSLEEIDEKALNEDVLNLFNYDIEGAVENAGVVLQIVADMEIFKQSGAYDSLCDAMSLSEVNEYVNFSALKQKSSIKTQMQSLSLAVQELKASGVMESIAQINDDNLNEKLNEIASKLAVVSENKTYVNKIITPLLECSVADNAVKYGLTVFGDYLEDLVVNINTNQDEFAKLKVEVVTTSEGKSELVTLLENTVIFANNLQIFTMSDDALLDGIINGGTESLGVLLDSYKNAELFGYNSDDKSAYIDFMSALQSSELSDIFYFEVAKEENFSWAENMTAVKILVDNLNVIKVDGSGLIDYMIDGGDYNKIVDALSKDDAEKLKPLFDHKLLYPMASKVINEINVAVADFVGEDYSEQIVMLDSKVAVDLNSQSQEIVDIIAEAISVNLSSLDFDNLTEEQIDQINVLLGKLEINATNNGVFKTSYNALLLKMASIIVTEIQELVGENLSSYINPELSSETNVAGDSAQLINLLNCLLENINTLDNSEITQINPEDLIAILDEFNNSKEILNGYFESPFNALLIHIVNEINGEISAIVGRTFSSNIVSYVGTVEMVEEYYYIKPVITAGLSILATENLDIKAVNINSLKDFLTSLRKCDYTTEAYNSLLTYISNEVIVSVNTLIDANDAELTETQYHLSAQESDILNILEAVNESESIINEKGVKISELNTEEKTMLARLLNVFQTNGNKSSGVFRSTYSSLINYVATENGTTYDVVKENFGNGDVIDWESFINQTI